MNKMNRFTALSMRRITDGVNRKKYRKNVIYWYKSIIDNVRWYAKRGHSQVDFRSFDIRTDYDYFLAFRLFAFKHSDFKICWTIHYESGVPKKKDIDLTHCAYDEDISSVEVKVKW